MQPPLFYAPPDHRDGDIIVLPAEEARHAHRVLRLDRGALVVVIDGLGTACRGEISSITGRRVTVRVHAELRDYGEAAVHLTLAAGLSVGSKFDSVVQRGTELGVKRFVPLITDKSRVKMDDPKRARVRLTRLEKVALAAVKQCRRSALPSIAYPVTLAGFLEEYEPDNIGLVFHPSSKSRPLDRCPLEESAKRITLLVGPEAGFSDDEFELALANGFIPVGLGERILRTETAAPVAVALVMYRLGELR